MVARIRDFMSGYGWPVLVAVTLFVLGAVFETKIELVQLKQEVQSLREDIQEVKTEIKEIHAILYIPFNSEGQTGVDGPRQTPETIGLLGPSQGISIPKLPQTEKSANSAKSIVFSLVQRATEGKSRNGLSPFPLPFGGLR